MSKILTAIAISAAALLAVPAFTAASWAQEKNDTKSLPPVTLDLKDAPVRSALEQLFKDAKVDYSIDPGVSGFVTLHVTGQPFENTLRLILRSSPVPLTYAVENGVYIVKVRAVETAGTVAVTPPPLPPASPVPAFSPIETFQLLHTDPADLAQLLGIQLMPTGVRFGNGTGGAGTGIGVGTGTPGSGPGAGNTGQRGGANNGNGANNNGSGIFRNNGLILIEGPHDTIIAVPQTGG